MLEKHDDPQMDCAGKLLRVVRLEQSDADEVRAWLKELDECPLEQFAQLASDFRSRALELRRSGKLPDATESDFDVLNDPNGLGGLAKRWTELNFAADEAVAASPDTFRGEVLRATGEVIKHAKRALSSNAAGDRWDADLTPAILHVQAIGRAARRVSEQVDVAEGATTRQPARHSPDFRSVHWYGTDYSFTPKQAAIVRVLWQAWKSGTPDIGHATLLESADADTKRLADVFKDSPAWNTLIVNGQTKGTKRLLPPKNS